MESSISRVTAALIRERFSGTRVPPQPAQVNLDDLDTSWVQAMAAAAQDELTPAGVLVPIIERAHGLTLLLTQRSAALKHHAGQVSFPGGRMEASDADIEATALRETHEEVGIAPDAVAVAGFIDPMPTITGYAVTPVIGVLTGPIETRVDPAEVEYAFEVPLSHLMDRRNEVTVERTLFGKTLPMVEFHWEGERIWGATAHMIVSLRKILLK